MKVKEKIPQAPKQTNTASNASSKKTNTTVNNNNNNNNNSNNKNSKVSSGKKSNLVLDSSFYDDNYNMKAADAMNYLKDNSLFTKYESAVIGKKEFQHEADKGLQKIANGKGYKFNIDIDGDGEYEEMTAAEAMAASRDSELDLFIDDVFLDVVNKHIPNFNKNYGFDFKKMLTPEVVSDLADKNIKVDIINNRTFTLSLVDDDGNILEDENGGKGSAIYGDWVIPDGNFSSSEQNLASLLDIMGYDCISKADFIGNEEEYDRVLSQVAQNLNEGLYSSSGMTTNDMYGKTTTSYSSGGSGSSSNSGGSFSNTQSQSILGMLKDMISPALEHAENKQEKNINSEILQVYKQEKQKDSNSSQDSIIIKVAAKCSTTADKVRELIGGLGLLDKKDEGKNENTQEQKSA